MQNVHIGPEVLKTPRQCQCAEFNSVEVTLNRSHVEQQVFLESVGMTKAAVLLAMSLMSQ